MSTTEQRVNLLYKERNIVADTDTDRKVFEEPRESHRIIYDFQIYSNTIPVMNPLDPGFSDPDLTISGSVQVRKLVTLAPITGAPNAYFSADLRDCIARNYGTDGQYNYLLFENDGVTPVPFGAGGWEVDHYAGILRFYKESTIPPGITAGFPPKISFFKYVGTKGVSSIASHSSLADLNVDDHIQYALLAGRSGGQNAIGGTDANDNLVLESTSDVTKGHVEISETTDSAGPSSGALQVVGGMSVAKKLYVNDTLEIGLNRVVSGSHTFVTTATEDIFEIEFIDGTDRSILAEIELKYLPSGSLAGTPFTMYIATLQINFINSSNSTTHLELFQKVGDSIFSVSDGAGTLKSIISCTGTIGSIVSGKISLTCHDDIATNVLVSSQFV